MAATTRDRYTPAASAKSRDRFRTALKFTLWTWAAYWPGGGLILLLLVLTGFFSTMVFLDALLPTVGADTLGTAATVVVLGSGVNLLYPVLLLYAARPFREPMSWSYLARRGRVPAIDFSGVAPVIGPMAAAPAAPAIVAKQGKGPFRAHRRNRGLRGLRGVR